MIQSQYRHNSIGCLFVPIATHGRYSMENIGKQQKGERMGGMPHGIGLHARRNEHCQK